jgi:hypothetical protein
MQLNEYTTDGFLKFSNGTGLITVDTNIYLTGYTETDPEFYAHSGDYYTTNPLGYLTGDTIRSRAGDLLSPINTSANMRFQV